MSITVKTERKDYQWNKRCCADRLSKWPTTVEGTEIMRQAMHV